MHNDNSRLEIIRSARKKLIAEIEELKEQLKKVTDEMKKNGFIENGRIIDPLTKHRNIAKTLFNSKPKEGIKYLNTNITHDDPEEVAKFLKEPDLNKRSIGDYLGDYTIEFNKKVLEAFVRSFDFHNQDFVECLRMFLSAFFLPGESQKINEIIQDWSNYYFECNPALFNNSDEVYVLAYAVIMLNTTLNNPNASGQNIEFGKEEAFVKTMLEYDGMNFQEETVRKVYNTIKTKPLMNFGNIINENYPTNKLNGELWYQSANIRVWKKRTFILLPEYLLILSNENPPQVRYKIALTNAEVSRCFDSNAKEFVINIHCRSQNDTINVIKTNKDSNEEQKNMKSFRFACNSNEEQKEWLNAIKKCLDNINDNFDNGDTENFNASS